MIEILDAGRLPKARVVGALVADILQSLKSRTVVGTNLLDIDKWTQEMITKAGASSCYVHYSPSFGSGPFGHYICTSVNDAVLHGLPHDYKLKNGDLVSLDLAVTLGGVVADSAISFVVGTAKPADLALIDSTQRALAAAIEVAKVGARVGDISYAISSVLEADGYTVNDEFGGHGVGSTMHQGPHISNIGKAGTGYKLRSGLLLAIEPWVMVDTNELAIDADGWTLKSVTGCRTAHSEHTVSITNDGAEIMTLPSQPA